MSRGDAWRWFASYVGQWELLGFGSWAIELRGNGAYVGQVSLNLPAGFPEAELGWSLWEEFEGNGYACEAALRAREFAYRTLGWDTLVSYIDAANTGSIHLAERMGAVLDPDAPTPGGLIPGWSIVIRRSDAAVRLNRRTLTWECRNVHDRTQT